MKFPNNTVSFIPDSHWYGSKYAPKGCYDDPNTNLVLLKYENENTNGTLPPIDHVKLQEHLGIWFISVLAPSKRDRDLLDETGLTANTYEKVLLEQRESWKIWKPPPAPTPGEGEYHGANWDGREMHDTPCKDVATHNRKLAMLGCLPDTYVKFRSK